MRRPWPPTWAGRRKLHLRFSLGTGLDAGVVVVPESGSTSAVSRLVGQDEQDLAGAFVWDYAMYDGSDLRGSRGRDAYMGGSQQRRCMHANDLPSAYPDSQPIQTCLLRGFTGKAVAP